MPPHDLEADDETCRMVLEVVREIRLQLLQQGSTSAGFVPDFAAKAVYERPL